jgi:glutathione S-transferase
LGVLLIGMLDSPFVRRVAVSMQLLGMGYEHANWSVGRDYERIRQYNPMVKVPTLVLDDGEVLSESAAILDYLDQSAGPARALLPASGRARRDALRLMALSMLAAEKGRDQLQESIFRPKEKIHEPWLERLRSQMNGGLGELDRYCQSRASEQWLIGSAMSQADITVSCGFTYLNDALPDATVAARHAHLAKFVARCEALEPFSSTHVPFLRPVAPAG